MRKDPVAIQNERVKAFANFLNALGLGLIGFAVIRPMTEGKLAVGDGHDIDTIEAARHGALFAASEEKLKMFMSEDAPWLFSQLPMWVYWLAVGLALHACSHYIVGYLRKGD